MSLWLVKFIPYSGGAVLELCFRSKEAAEEALHVKFTSDKPRVSMTDDFGIRIVFDAFNYSILFTNTDISAALQSALHTANQEAMQTYGLANTDTGSTIQ